MLIVSQWNNTIINLDNTGIIEIDEYHQRPFQINIYVNDVWREIGQYATQERTKAVLQEIVRAYNSEAKCYYMPEE